MENKFGYSFDDEAVSRFFYDMDNKKFEVCFTGLNDEKERFLDKPCIFNISDWSEAKSKVGDEEKLYPLDRNMGVFSMILYIKYEGNTLELLVNTIDNRYITLFFTNAKIRLINVTNER